MYFNAHPDGWLYDFVELASGAIARDWFLLAGHPQMDEGFRIISRRPMYFNKHVRRIVDDFGNEVHTVYGVGRS